jgi:predicted TIM-barrel fold metal-dependent hydrolase
MTDSKVKCSRREFTAGLISSSLLLSARPKEPSPDKVRFDLMKEVAKHRKLDAYATSVFSTASLQQHIDYAERYGISKMFVANPMTQIELTPEQFKAHNDKVIQAVKQFPNHFIGQFTLNPRFKKDSLDEIDRCLDAGMMGTRLYQQVKINDPLYAPIIEKLARLNILIFMHGECQMGVGGYKMAYDAGKVKTISTPDDFVEVARRYPEAMFQFAHIGGGSDWECMCKTFQPFSNIYVDTGGSNNEEYMVDFAVRTLGEDRVFFGSDNSHYQSIGKIFASELSDKQKQKVFFTNYREVLKKGGFHVD